MKSLTPKLVTRTEWGALKPSLRRSKWRGLGGGQAVPKVVFSNTQTVPCLSKAECIKAVQQLQVDHMKRLGLPDVQYNFLIGADGNVYEGRGWLDNAEDGVIEIAIIEDLATDDDEPYHRDMIEQFTSLLLYGVHNGFILKEFNIIDKIVCKPPKSYKLFYLTGLGIVIILCFIILVRKKYRRKCTKEDC